VASDVRERPTKLKKGPLEMVFIRRPIIERAGPGVEVLANTRENPHWYNAGRSSRLRFIRINRRRDGP